MLLYTNLGVMLYQFGTKPIDGKVQNRLENFNETCIIVISFHLIWFTDYVSDLHFEIQAGRSMLAFLAINSLVNLIMIINALYHKMILLKKKYTIQK